MMVQFWCKNANKILFLVILVGHMTEGEDDV